VTRSFALTFDYRCPYARIAHDHVVEGLRGGADWKVTFLPFSLGQSHVEPGKPSVWENPDQDSGIIAQQLAIAIRDGQPDRFVEAHHALFEHRHSAAGNLRDRKILSEVVAEVGVDVGAAWADVDSGRPLEVFRAEHTGYAASHEVWGVPTFVMDDAAVFVRLLDLARGDQALAISTVERILDAMEWENLNEFKHTSVPR
jgi:hypothetical protein